MKGNTKKVNGVAIGNLRLDSIRIQDLGKGRPKAKEARERLIDGEAMGEAVAAQQGRMATESGKDGMTARIVEEMGGNRAAEKQAAGYTDLLEAIRSGMGTAGTADGSKASAARERMIRRQGGNGGLPDVGRDMANRRACPKGSGERKDGEAGDQTERFKAFVNASRC